MKNLCALLGVAMIASIAQQRSDAKGPIFEDDILPIFQQHCLRCHSGDSPKHGLSLEGIQSVINGGDSGTVLVAGETEQSNLYHLVQRGEMPPEPDKQLSETEVEIIKQWILGGLGARTEYVAAETKDSFTSDDRDHWSFQPVMRPEIPVTRRDQWVQNPIDRFILARLEAADMAPSPAAAPRQLLRRTYLDLIGLPPTPEEISVYLTDQGEWQTADTYQRLVERLLANPGYGERWGRHWLDLVRYGETTGYEVDLVKPFVWRYRDYVIRALNEDRPYDRFVLEQLAGDELPDANTDSVIATGFYTLGPWDAELAGQRDQAIAMQSRYDQLDDMVSTTCQVFLGLTMGCARCHNHKFEPLTTHDYYSLLAIFNTLTRPRVGRYGKEGGRIELAMPAGTYEQLEALAERDRLIAIYQLAIAQARAILLEQLLAAGKSKLPPEAVSAFRVPSGLRTAVERKLVRQYADQLDGEIKLGDKITRGSIRHAEDWIRKRREATPNLPRASILRETSSQPPATHLLIRGKVTDEGPEVEPGVPVILTDSPIEFLPTGKYTSRRRLSLARWIASHANPLTARVIVNRVWQYHFGKGLVRTPSDFGLQGRPPTHPELLDWLAAWFVHDSDWSLKKLHHLIMTSSTYRMSKTRRAECLERDPENELFWRFPYRRLEVEAMRDTVLFITGRLNRAMYGPSVFPHIPTTVMEANRDTTALWMPFHESNASRRTVYTFVRRTMIVPMLDVLDVCDTTKTAPERRTSTVATQALTLLNGEFVIRQTRHLAARLQSEVGDDTAAQIDRAYQLTLCRQPTSAERAELLEFVEHEVREAIAKPPDEGARIDLRIAKTKALQQVCRLIFNLNEFAYTD